MDEDNNVVGTKRRVDLSDMERESEREPETHGEKPLGLINTDASQESLDSSQSGGPYTQNPQRRAETSSNHKGQNEVHALEHLAANLSGANHNEGYNYGANISVPGRALNDSDLERTFIKPSKNIGEIVVDNKGKTGWRPRVDNTKIYWIPGTRISSDVLNNELALRAGPLATNRKFEFQGQMGYLIENAGKFMDSVQIRTLETMSSQANLSENSELPQGFPQSSHVVKEPVRLGNFGSPLRQAILANPGPSHLKDSSVLYQFGGQKNLETLPPKMLVDFDKQCGVATPNSLFGPWCREDLTCTTHSEDLKMQVTGRSKPYGMKARTNPEIQIRQEASMPPTRMIINKGDHLELKDSEEKKRLPYALEGNLGHGGYASVEMVRDLNTGSVYARKIIKNVSTRTIDTVKASFLNEVRVMRLLASHRHIIQVFATYIAQRELALILSPVADNGDLHDFLGRYQDAAATDPVRAKETMILHRAFGCLTSGLTFMHQERVRHKDIKPKNILIHQGSVLYTDFGISLDFSQEEQSTTTGNPQSYTRRYCAPEVAEWGNRNSKSDIFSLGCVFIEILAAIYPHLFRDTLLAGPFHEKVDGLFLESLKPLDEFCYWSVGLLQEMLQKSPTDRPTATMLLEKMSSSVFDLFCEPCSNDLNRKGIPSNSPESNNDQISTAVPEKVP